MLSLLHRNASMNCSTWTQRKHEMMWGNHSLVLQGGRDSPPFYTANDKHCFGLSPKLFCSSSVGQGRPVLGSARVIIKQSNPLSEQNKPDAAALHHTPACLPPAHSLVTRSSRTGPGAVIRTLLRRPAVNQATSSRQPSKVILLDGSTL